MDAEVEGSEAILPRGGVGSEAPADGAEEAARGGAGGGGVEALEHGLGGPVRGVARGRAVRQEGVDVLVLARRRRRHWFPPAWTGLEIGGDGWMDGCFECEVVGGRGGEGKWGGKKMAGTVPALLL